MQGAYRHEGVVPLMLASITVELKGSGRQGTDAHSHGVSAEP